MTLDLKEANLHASYEMVNFTTDIPIEWIRSLFSLKKLSNPIHRKIVPQMYHAIPKKTICACIRQESKIVATGLGILDRDYIGVYAIHVHKNFRGRGYARQICTGILSKGLELGAEHAYLQVVEGNIPAESLYQSLGFQHLYTYWFRVRN